ncbi:molecular chaperone DnaJ [Candidatus Uhrbacteria bacterium]|nr:molecular chaperone DnaJ [Candidatus Uhrbacteria bacterium]
MAKDYYDLLGVAKNASEGDIKAAFRKLAHQYHPDKQGGDAEKFKEINEAYQVLSNPEKRRRYDRFGHNFEQAGQGFGGFGAGGFDGAMNFDVGDLGEMFGDIFGGRTGARTRENRGRNIEMDLQMSFRESVFGAKKTLRVYKDANCNDCGGAGFERGSKTVDCLQCGGAGRVRRVQQTILGTIQTAVTCPHCQGQGRVPEKSCRPCGGRGVIKQSKEIELAVPAGIADGEMLRMTGEGEAAGRGGRSGDLYATVRVKTDPAFTRDGFDIKTTKEISMARAALGGSLEIETLDGPVELKLPAGTQPGQVFRLKARGVPFLKRSGRGDHFVEIKVKIPAKLNREQRRILEDWE